MSGPHEPDAVPITSKDGIWPRAVRILENAWTGRWDNHERRIRAVEQLQADGLTGWRGDERRASEAAFTDEQRKQINDMFALAGIALITGDAFNRGVDSRFEFNEGRKHTRFLLYMGGAFFTGCLSVGVGVLIAYLKIKG